MVNEKIAIGIDAMPSATRDDRHSSSTSMPLKKMTSLDITTICSARWPPAPVLSPWRSVAGASHGGPRHPEEDLEVVTETFRWRGAQTRGADRL
jgi:hypothetical protein